MVPLSPFRQPGPARRAAVVGVCSYRYLPISLLSGPASPPSALDHSTVWRFVQVAKSLSPVPSVTGVTGTSPYTPYGARLAEVASTVELKCLGGQMVSVDHVTFPLLVDTYYESVRS